MCDAGYCKSYDTLSTAVLRNTGHMVPHDNPLIGQVGVRFGFPYLSYVQCYIMFSKSYDSLISLVSAGVSILK